MKVLLDHRIQTGGVGRYGRELAEALRQMPGIETDEMTAAGLSSRPFTPWGRRAVRVRAKQWGADLVHGLHFEVPRGVTSVVTIQDLIPLEYPSMPPIRKAIFRQIINASMKHSRKIIVPSLLTADAVMRHGATASKVEVAPLWVSKTFRPSTDVEKIAARKAFAGGRPYVASLSHDKLHKNTRVIAATAPLVDAALGLVIVAPGKQLLSEEELRTFYAGAEVFLLPSLLEGFGLPALESLACGVPVICGPRVGALPYIKGGVIEVDVADPNAIASAIESLMLDATMRQHLASEGLSIAAGLTLERTAEGTAQIYHECLNA